MVKCSENGVLGAAWLEGRGSSEGSVVLGASLSRERRAAPGLQIQTEEPVVASYGLAKTATLTMLQYGLSWRSTSA